MTGNVRHGTLHSRRKVLLATGGLVAGSAFSGIGSASEASSAPTVDVDYTVQSAGDGWVVDVDWSVSSDSNVLQVKTDLELETYFPDVYVTVDSEITEFDGTSTSVSGQATLGTDSPAPDAISVLVEFEGDDGSEWHRVRFHIDDGGDDGDSSPSIDEFSVDTRQTGPWFRAETDWTVSDEGGDLAIVTLDLLDGSSVVDSSSTSVDGETASSSLDVRTKGSADAVELTVTGDDGGETSELVTLD